MFSQLLFFLPVQGWWRQDGARGQTCAESAMVRRSNACCSDTTGPEVCPDFKSTHYTHTYMYMYVGIAKIHHLEMAGYSSWDYTFVLQILENLSPSSLNGHLSLHPSALLPLQCDNSCNHIYLRCEGECLHCTFLIAIPQLPLMKSRHGSHWPRTLFPIHRSAVPPTLIVLIARR